MIRTTDNICQSLSPLQHTPQLPTPDFVSLQKSGRKIFLAAECMRTHTADAGWQLTIGLEHAGYQLWGHKLHNSQTDVSSILKRVNPEIVIVQDKREWECLTAKQRGNTDYKFHNVDALRQRNDIFKLTVLKDCHQRPEYHSQSADEIGVHAWITYYHPNLVKHFAPFVRKQHLIRTYHTIDPKAVPEYSPINRSGSILSGAVSQAYPLRTWFRDNISSFPEMDYLVHPGYHDKGCVTPRFLQSLSKYKVAICTSSKYGYSLRKIIEATACGCIVITDLPSDDPLPLIDDNLIRIPSSTNVGYIKSVLNDLYLSYNPNRQQYFSNAAKQFYDFKVSAVRLAHNIENKRNEFQ